MCQHAIDIGSGEDTCFVRQRGLGGCDGGIEKGCLADVVVFVEGGEQAIAGSEVIVNHRFGDACYIGQATQREGIRTLIAD